MSNIPTINSGVVHAPGALSDSNDPTSPTNAAPSQASQDVPSPQVHTTESGPRLNGPRHQGAPMHPASQQSINPQDPHHQLNKHAYEIGTETGRQRPFPPMSEGQHGVAGGEAAPPLPPRAQDVPVPEQERSQDGVRSERRHPGPRSQVGEQPHIAGLHRGDYASGAPGHTTTTDAPQPAGNTHLNEAPLAPGLGNASHGGTDGRTTAENPAGTSRLSTGEKVHEGASGVKGIVAAVHGAGEELRGTFNREVDRAFHDVCVLSPSSSPASGETGENVGDGKLAGEKGIGGEEGEEVPMFPHLGILKDFDLERGRILGVEEEGRG